MKTMNKLIRIGFLCVLIVGFSGIHANALSLSFYDSYYVGHISPGVPSSEAAEVGYINELIDVAIAAGPTTIGSQIYDRSDSINNGPFTPAIVAGSDRQGTSIGAGFEYVLGKYGGGMSSGDSYVWYLAGGFSEALTLPGSSPADDGGLGLSHTTGFNPVPVPAAVYLLGAGFVGLAGLRRKIKK